MKEINKVLTTIQNEMKVPKNLYNKFGKFNYRNAESIYEEVKPLLEKHGAGLSITEEVKEVGGKVFVIATAIFTYGDEEVKATSSAWLEFEDNRMNHAQQSGSVSSYARKYALNGLFLLDDTKDADTEEYNSCFTKAKADEAQRAGVDIERLAKYLKKDVKQLIDDDLVKAIKTKQNASEQRRALNNG